LCGWRDISAPLGILQVDDDLLQQQQEAYKIQGVDESEQVTAQQLRKKRKQAGGDEVSVASDMTLKSILLTTATDYIHIAEQWSKAEETTREYRRVRHIYSP
jgi:hypothetical protein